MFAALPVGSTSAPLQQAELDKIERKWLKALARPVMGMQVTLYRLPSATAWSADVQVDKPRAPVSHVTSTHINTLGPHLLLNKLCAAGPVLFATGSKALLVQAGVGLDLHLLCQLQECGAREAPRVVAASGVHCPDSRPGLCRSNHVLAPRE